MMERIKVSQSGLGGSNVREKVGQWSSTSLKTVEEMKRTRPPEGIDVAHVDGGNLHDCRLPGTSSFFTPLR